MQIEALRERLIPLETAMAVQNPAAFGLVDDAVDAFKRSLAGGEPMGPLTPAQEFLRTIGAD
jgi:hypothetical protein